MTRFGTITVLCLCAGCTVGCGNVGAAPETSRAGSSRDGTYYLTYVPSSDPIPVAKRFDMKVAVFENADRSTRVTDASLAVEGWMPAHEHGMYTTPTVTSNHDGTYSVHGMLFHMEMHWEIRVDVTRAGVTDRAVFNVVCCEE